MMPIEPTPAQPHKGDLGRARLIEAMQRLLGGQPLHVRPGRLSALALAEEAGVERNRLNREYADLRDEFKRLVALGRTTRDAAAGESELRAELERARERLAALQRRYDAAHDEGREWKLAAEAMARVVQVREVELARLRSDLDVARKRLARLTDDEPKDGFVGQPARSAGGVRDFRSAGRGERAPRA